MGNLLGAVEHQLPETDLDCPKTQHCDRPKLFHIFFNAALQRDEAFSTVIEPVSQLVVTETKQRQLYSRCKLSKSWPKV